MVKDTAAGRWFMRVVWIGIAANIALALPTIAAPAAILAWLDLPTATPDLWPRVAGVNMILLGAFSTPAALDPDRHRPVAWLAIASRLVGVVFFSFEPGYRLFALYDGVFLAAQGALLVAAIRAAGRAPARANVAAA